MRTEADYKGGDDLSPSFLIEHELNELNEFMEKIELINMALFEISRECQIVDALSKESLRHIEVIEAKGKEVPETFRKLKEQHDEMLSEIHKMLRDVMEEIGEYMNANDIVQGVDVAINKPIYDLVYERKNEKDYENHE